MARVAPRAELAGYVLRGHDVSAENGGRTAREAGDTIADIVEKTASSSRRERGSERAFAGAAARLV